MVACAKPYYKLIAVLVHSEEFERQYRKVLLHLDTIQSSAIQFFILEKTKHIRHNAIKIDTQTIQEITAECFDKLSI